MLATNAQVGVLTTTKQNTPFFNVSSTPGWKPQHIIRNTATRSNSMNTMCAPMDSLLGEDTFDTLISQTIADPFDALREHYGGQNNSNNGVGRDAISLHLLGDWLSDNDSRVLFGEKKEFVSSQQVFEDSGQPPASPKPLWTASQAMQVLSPAVVQRTRISNNTIASVSLPTTHEPQKPRTIAPDDTLSVSHEPPPTNRCCSSSGSSASEGSIKVTTPTVRFRHHQSENWAEKFEELEKFQAKNGHCLVPNAFPKNPALAEWVKRQRYQYKLKRMGKHSTMSEERIHTLKNLGFVWNSHDQVWEERLKELKQYRSKFNHCNIPSNYKNNPQLAIWVKVCIGYRKSSGLRFQFDTNILILIVETEETVQVPCGGQAIHDDKVSYRKAL